MVIARLLSNAHAPGAGMLLLVVLSLATARQDALAAPGSATCIDVSVSSILPAVEAAEVIVIGSVIEVEDRVRVAVRPEAYLRGPAEAAPVVLRWPDPLPRCPLAEFARGQRVLLFLDADAHDLQWPGAGDAFLLQDGRALRDGAVPVDMPERELVDAVRAVTGQYAIPAAEGEGASIDWVTTVLPVSLAVGLLFAIGLYLMRIWHRIDPS